MIIRGDLASCYYGRDARLDRTVFLKILNPSLTADKDICARFEREAKAAARLDHPNLVRIHEFGEDPEEGLYMILEWITGKSLREHLKGGKRFSDSELIALAGQVLAGLKELHRAGILHRDVKPENILIGNDGRARITDFSLAALQGSVKLTHHQAIVGTPAYMSPEQAAGQSPDGRSDLFSVGTILLELATGTNPFEAGELLESLRRIRELNVQVDELLGDDFSDDLKRLIASCLEKDPSRRIASAEAALNLIGEHEQPALKTPAQQRRGRSYLYLAGFIVLLVFAAVYLRTDETRQPETSALSDTTQPAGTSEDTTVTLKAAEDTLSAGTVPERIIDVREENSSAADQPNKPLPAKESSPRSVTQDSPLQAQDPQPNLPDSIDLYLTTEPWAHILINGQRIGTTPLKSVLRLAAGEHEFTFQNPAFPVIMNKRTIADSTSNIHFLLTDFVADVELRVIPWGEIYIDDEHRGTSPLADPVYLLPGSHKLYVTHPALAPLTDSITVSAGETIQLMIDLNKSELAVLPAKRSGQ
ncbi:protein kinase [bacterium]|nr:protein kinase [bacterium]